MESVVLERPDPGGSRRRDRKYRAREFLNTFSSLGRVQKCGSHVVRSDGVPVVLAGERAHFRNVTSCASVHVCPVCAGKIRNERADEVATAVTAHLRAGGGVEFVTVTLPHDQGDGLAALLDAVGSAWRAVTRGRAWSAERTLYGIDGSIKALEVSHGPSGWHPHLHVLLFTAVPLRGRDRRGLSDGIFGRWSRAVQQAGYRAPSVQHGIDVRPVRSSSGIGEYVSKVAMELSRSDLKLGRVSSHRSAFQILAELVASGDVDDLALWWEYERATKGKRALTWSRGLKGRYAVGERTDVEIAEAEQPGVVVGVVPAALWPFLCRQRGARLALVHAAESDGPGGVNEFLAKMELAAFGGLLPWEFVAGDVPATREARRLERRLVFARAGRGEPGVERSGVE